MPGSSSNASFIPKRGTTNRRNKSRSGRVYLLTIISYVLIIATLIASAGIFFYERYVTKMLQKEISTMNAEVNDFKQADLEQVQEFDRRLKIAKKRIEYTVSLASIFDAIEVATIQTVQLKSLQLLRDKDERIVLEAEIVTDNFDSSLFQRSVFESNSVIQEVEVKNLTLGITREEDEVSTSRKTVSFTARLAVPLGAVPYIPDRNVEPIREIVIQPAIEISSTTEDIVNQE
jgi:hypothetical protein